MRPERVNTLLNSLTKLKSCYEAVLIKEHASDILLGYVSDNIPLTPLEKNDASHLINSMILSWFVDHPDVQQYALKYFNINTVAPFELHRRIEFKDDDTPAKKPRLENEKEQPYTDYQIVNCCYKLLKTLPAQFSLLWNWAKLVGEYDNHPDPEITWILLKCISITSNMSEVQTKKLGSSLNITSIDDFKYLNSRKTYEITPNDCKDGINFTTAVQVGNIILPVCDPKQLLPGILVPVKSTMENLKSLALAVASGKAICLMGPVGSGKTALVQHLAAITGRNESTFKKLQLGDQTDSRMLLGTHHCTELPGEFVWRPGLLTQAVQGGHWLLLEDIDCATFDVASMLSSLLERKVLTVPGFRDSLPVTPGFQLFVTQRTTTTNFGFQKKLSTASTLLQKQLIHINVEPLSTSELKEIIQTIFPALTTISTRIVDLFMYFSDGNHNTSFLHTEAEQTVKNPNVTLLKGSRPISTRDLWKWCERCSLVYKETTKASAVLVLQDALDLFTCSIPCPKNRLELSKIVGTHLGLVETQVNYLIHGYKPTVSFKSGTFEVGRSTMKREENIVMKKRANFCFTRPSTCLLERMARCVVLNEPVLLVGETGTGKTSTVQFLARETAHDLIVINMNQQSDTADLLGGYKPVDLKYTLKPIKDCFVDLFQRLFNVEKNQKFMGHIEYCCKTENWPVLCVLIQQSYNAAIKKLHDNPDPKLLKEWLKFEKKLQRYEDQLRASAKLSFAFIEGTLVKAMQKGSWVLLDELNLASAEILECLAGLLGDKTKSIQLVEKGDGAPVAIHPDFTVFACMNPATDVGKKDLPIGLRNRFTEFFVDEITDKNDLLILIAGYLQHMNLDKNLLTSLCDFYINIKKDSQSTLSDGSGNPPLFSLRTLCRALTAATKANCGTVTRSLYEAFCLSFLTQLDRPSHVKVEAIIAKTICGKKALQSILNQKIPEPKVPGVTYLQFEGHWIAPGNLEPIVPEGYILTPTIRKNLRDIARIVSLAKLPVLLQGDTSVGKTSLITYIAKASGNYCVRINNHEHTDLQEYIGAYSSDSTGKLVFKEGILVEAMRKGHWIILDELNLAPSDVLEALNRVLDDNRELYIPETQQVVKAHPNFMLFATQNPPGLYGGRKMLSRAFRNRFVELHFDLIPKNELEVILHERCHVPTSYCKKMINVMQGLQLMRRGSAAVQGKDGFITLRDLFRWGQRYKLASKELLTTNKFYDWDQHIADEGYLILAGKVREPSERDVIINIIEKSLKREVNPDNLFSLHENTSPVTRSILEKVLNNELQEYSHVVWTFNMRRLAVLIVKSFEFLEPVLLVGETGCGKTTICQVIAALKNTDLLTVNCHMHTESADFLGGLRPVRHNRTDGRLFEWVDGPLIKAMENGNLFLTDEISLADDSVLERLNSLLEPERQLVLAERSTGDGIDVVTITANPNFHFIATMNPGGDFGKKELSPALRNRLTEIWCDNVTSRVDLTKVLERSLSPQLCLRNSQEGSSKVVNCILDFSEWLKASELTSKFPFSIRDLLSWVHFMNNTVSKNILKTFEAYAHGACLIFLDCFGTALTGHVDFDALNNLRTEALEFLQKQTLDLDEEFPTRPLSEVLNPFKSVVCTEADGMKFGIKPFYIEVAEDIGEHKENYAFNAPTTGENTLRLLRGMQLNKPILLEGNPGVGKTSLVTALAKVTGHNVVRINLSDQTDIADLFGTDLPTEDGLFAFKEGVFLKAMQNGDWILLDELNLAPQPVLEGLNACLDHRGELYIPELGKTFKVKKETHLFACQNPIKQGGARRGLPLSFLNRFTQVYIDTLTKEDLYFIVEVHYPSIATDILHKIIDFNCKVAHEINVLQTWGHKGSPWEMNLRDVQRWCDAIVEDQNSTKDESPGKFVDFLYINRMRTNEDKKTMAKIYDEIFLPDYPRSAHAPSFEVSEKQLHIGDVVVPRNLDYKFNLNNKISGNNLYVLRSQVPVLKALAQCVKMNWLSIVIGSTGTGKSSVIQALADLTGNELQIIPVTSAMDVSDLLGGFEQIDYNRNLDILHDKIENYAIQTMRNVWLTNKKLTQRTDLNENFLKLINTSKYNKADDNAKCQEKVNTLLSICEKIRELNMGVNIKELDEIEVNLKKLSEVFCKEVKSIGGKFQWIDSILVKAMLKGSWLLVDNVNLTSSAVLDRLNGFLESNGTLSIPERGEFDEITPHSNFRIFFTMDPKYGEISRAMRNRGVEIYILEQDELNEPMNLLDLHSLLHSCGLGNEYYYTFEECHKILASFIHGLEKPTISHLLQVAYLATQQISRGISPKIAIESSFIDVYIKPRNGSDFVTPCGGGLAEQKNGMLKALQAFIKDCESPQPINTSHTLSVTELSKHTSIAVTKQLVYPILQSYNDKNEQCLIDTIFAYQKCPTEFRNLLVYVMKHETDTENFKGTELSKSMDKLLPCLQTFNKQRKVIPTTSKDETASNSLFLFLYSEIINKFDEISNLEYITPFEYSKLIASKKVADISPELAFIKYLSTCISKLDTVIQRVFLDQGICKSNELTCQLIECYNWKRRFYKICSTLRMFTNEHKTLQIYDESISQIMLHKRWLNQKFIQSLMNIAPNDRGLRVWNKKFGEVDKNERKIHKTSNELKKLFGQPNLYKDQECYKLAVANSQMFSALSYNKSLPLKQQVRTFLTKTGSVSNYKLALDVPDKDCLSNAQQIITNLSSNEADVGENNLGKEMLPLFDYVFLRVMLMIQNQFMDVTHRMQVANLEMEENLNLYQMIQFDFPLVLSKLVEFAKEHRGFSPKLISLMELLLKVDDYNSNDADNCTSSLIVTFWQEYYKKAVNLPALCPDVFMNCIDVSQDEQQSIDHDKFTTNSPLMLYYTQQLSLNHDVQAIVPSFLYKTISLKDHENYITKLKLNHNILWKNMGVMNASLALKMKSDAVFECYKFRQFILFLYLKISQEKQDKLEYKDHLIEDIILSLKENGSAFAERIIKFLNNARTTHEILTEMLNKNLHECYKNRCKIVYYKAVLGVSSSSILMLFMMDMDLMDSVQKQTLKLEYKNEDVNLFHIILSSFYIQGVVSGVIDTKDNCFVSSDVLPSFYAEGNPNRENLKSVHPLCESFLRKKKETEEYIEKYKLENSYRPQKPSYREFVSDCSHFVKSFLASETVGLWTKKSLYDIFEKLMKSLHQGADLSTYKNYDKCIADLEAWLSSVHSFYNKVEKEYAEAFPDLAKLILFSLSNLISSVTNVRYALKELYAKTKHHPISMQALRAFVLYPNVIENHDVKDEEYSKRFLHVIYKNLIDDSVQQESANASYLKTARTFALLTMNLHELLISSLTKREFDVYLREGFLATVSAISETWQEYQKSVELKKKEEEALYVTKSKCDDEDEEVTQQREISEMFPSYAEQDFSEFKTPTLEQNKTVKPQKADTIKPIISPEDVTVIYEIYSKIITNLSVTEWLSQTKKAPSIDYVTPIMQRYQLFSVMIEKAWLACDVDFEGKVAPTLMVMLSKLQEAIAEDVLSQKIDFYRSPWVSETKQCLPLLLMIQNTTKALLEEWPDFPSLRDIMTIVGRILEFPVTSAVARFLTGLELLRDKIEEWNKQAHSENNMVDISLQVGQQIMNWRKLELSHWKESFNHVLARKQNVAHKYWFHLYRCISNENVNDKFINVVKEFITSSNVAEYETRVKLVYIFHCHCVHMEKSDKRDKAISILWNLYLYYDQFNAHVANYIKEKRAPIEKKLKDFVKICSWDRDLSYWNVKDTVEKAHKVLHKHTKEFEKLLEEPVKPFFAMDIIVKDVVEYVGIWDRPKRTTPGSHMGGSYLVDILNYITATRSIKKYLDEAKEERPYLNENNLLVRVPSLFNKAKKLCKDSMNSSNYPVLIQGLDDFVTQVIETSKYLGSLEVDTTMPKNKQTSQATQILQQKRKALTDLFRYLTKMGLNYRTGLVILNMSHNLYDLTIPPVNLQAAISYLKSRRCDTSLVQLWSGCENYFQKNLFRHQLLEIALRKPHEDLGLQNIERCKGFAAMLLKITNDQKKSIAKCSRQLCELRDITSNLTAALEIDEGNPRLDKLRNELDILYEVHSNILVPLEQLTVLLNCCPEDVCVNASIFEPAFDNVISDSPITKCFKNSENWSAMYNEIKVITTLAKAIKTALQKCKNNTMTNVLAAKESIRCISISYITAAENAKRNLYLMHDKVLKLIEYCNFNVKTIVQFEDQDLQDSLSIHPIARSICSLWQYLENTITRIDALDETVVTAMDEDSTDVVGEFSKKCEDFIATMLLVIETIYKNHLSTTNDKESEIVVENTEKEHSESKDILEEKHLSLLLGDKLAQDFKSLQLKKLILKATQLHNTFVSHLIVNREVVALRDLGMRVVPILEQFVLFVQYFLTQKVAAHRVSTKMLSVLLKIFMDLMSKGFCKPADVDMQEGEGEGGQMSGSGTGLAEGEGKKDVSDRIENQDQLDDAKRPGEENKEEDKDCKEEESGINMTDDFESHLQDVEPKEGEQSDKDDEEDPDKQMGETDNTADKLDQQIWGSDDDQDEDESNQKDKEEKGTGESTGEKEMGAKDEEQGMDDGETGKEKKKKKDINEMQEPEIDDDHIDPYHGNPPQLPEPEEYEIPDNINNMEENEDNQDGETETENPFEIDVPKDNIPEENPADDGSEKEKNNEGLEISDEEYEGVEEGENDGVDPEQESADKDKGDDDKKSETGEESKDEGENIEENEEQTPQDEAEKDQDPLEKQQDVPPIADKIDEAEQKDENQERKDPSDEANPSNNDQSEKEAQNAEMDTGTDDNVQINPDQKKDEEAEAYEQSQEQVGDERNATGRSQLDKSEKGHRGQKEQTSHADTSSKEKEQKKNKQENKPGQTEQERTLGEVNKSHKQSRTLNVEKDDQEMEDGGKDDSNNDQSADAYQHVKQAKQDDIQVVDAATKEQADQQPVLQKEDEEAEELRQDEELPMEVDEEIQVEKSDKEIHPEKATPQSEEEPQSGNRKDGGEEKTGEAGMEVEGENVVTYKVARGNENTYHTRMDVAMDTAAGSEMQLEEYMTLSAWLASGAQPDTSSDVTRHIWRDLWTKVGGQARNLSERLRLVLEPTTRSRLAGDFRTGRRINMRRIIPYIASHFTKDRIWLRRTKPAKREYKIAIAIDDSSSMSDNQSKELAFESLALVSQALNLLESGDLAVISFGKEATVLHPFSEQFSEHSGAKIIERLQFKQGKTKVKVLLDFVSVMFDQQPASTDALNAKLLIIVSDGRGINSEGDEQVALSVRNARQRGIFIVYVILDNPKNKNSILDIKRVSTKDGGHDVSPYLDTFPLPFYVIVRDLTTLPYVLGDALRQWFELATNSQ